MVNGMASIRRSPVLTNVLDAPITELAVSYDVNAVQNLVDAGPL